MARPKTKLWEGSTTCFQYATLRLPPEHTEIGISADAAQARCHLSLVKAAQAFFNRHAKTIEQIKNQFALTNGSSAGDLVNLILLTFFDIITRPELVLKPDKQTPKRLCAFLAALPDFTLDYLTTLRRAFVKHQRWQPAFQRGVIALRERKPIVDSYGKVRKFEDATDLEICAALKFSPATYKQAKRYLAAMDATT